MIYQETIKREIRNSERISFVVPFFVNFLMIIGIIKWHPLFFMIILILGMALLMNVLWKIFGVVVITVNENHLEIATKFIFRQSCKKYLINEISKLRVLKNTKGDNYTSSGYVNILGVRHHPEKWREYDLVPLSIRFTYKKKEVKLGEGFKKFSANKMVDAIIENQKK